MVRVLIVDDDQSIRLTLAAFLRKAGYTVDVAEAVEPALALLSTEPIDVVVSDLIMPGLTGIDLLHRVRGMAPRVQVILMTGDPTVETAADAVRAGAFDYLTKPITRDAILHRVGNAAKLKEAKDEEERLAAVNRQHLADLERLVAERTTQLLQSQKMETVGRLAGGIAHDFNNLLTVIQGTSELLLSSFDASDTRREELMEVVKAARRSAALTRQLLAFSRKQVLELKPVNVSALVTEQAKLLTRLLGERIALITDLPGDLPWVNADAGQIEQIVLNLSVNARDAMPEGGRLTISTATVEVSKEQAARVPEGRPGRFVRLSVADTGTGIPPEVLGRIFEPFFTTKGEGKGTGLGLSVCYGIACQHGGWIEVQSRVGEGSCFTAYLPVAETTSGADAGPADTTRAVGLGRLRAKCALVVDDQPAVTKVAARVLERADCTVLVAETVAEATAVFEREQERIDVLVSDVVLPDGDGVALAESLQGRRPKLGVVLMSGYSDENARWSLIERKGWQFLGKPCSPDDLLGGGSMPPWDWALCRARPPVPVRPGPETE